MSVVGMWEDELELWECQAVLTRLNVSELKPHLVSSPHLAWVYFETTYQG